jgi:chromo domain-containing protein 1
MSGSSHTAMGSGAPLEGNIPDDISLTSTMESQHDSEHEFEVEEIHAEDIDPADPASRRYLIEWTGYMMDRWTWEPAHHVGPTAREEWEEKKSRQALGEIQPFDVARFNDAVEAAEKAKFERHRNRNLRRQREGLPLIFYPGETEGDYYEIVDDDSDEDMPDLPPPKPVRTHSNPEAPSSPKSHGKDHASLPQRPNPTKSKPQSLSDLPAKPPSKAKSTATTGYQGTARKPSLTLPGKTRPPLKTAETTKSSAAALGPSQKAKKSNVKPQARSASGNVFIGGKKPRVRQNLGAVMADASRQPKQFGNMRVLNKAGKYSREMADRAPTDPHLLGLQRLSNISIDAAGDRQAGHDSDAPPSHGDTSPSGTSVVATFEPAVSTPRPRRDSLSGEGQATQLAIKKSALRKTGDTASADGRDQPPAKKVRSVRFTGDDPAAPGLLVTTRILEDTEMADEPEVIVIDDDRDDEEEGLFVGELPRPRFASEASPRPPTPPLPPSSLPIIQEKETRIQQQETHLRQNERLTVPRSETQGVAATVVFGPSGSQAVDVTFEGPSSGPSSWQARLRRTSTLHFSHACTAYAFEKRLLHTLDTPLSCGNLIPRSTCGNLDVAAEQLILGSFAVVYHAEDFSIIIYPTKCDEWKAMMPASEGNGPESTALKYLVFKAGKAGMFLTAPTATLQRTQRSASEDFMHQVYGLDYGKLLPDGMRNSHGPHNFFLAFPPSRGSVLQMTCVWLHSVNPNCRLFVSDIPGDWTAYVAAAKVEGGAFIMHSKALPTIRFFAGIQNLLHAKSSHTLFWKFEEKLQHLKLKAPSRNMVEESAPFSVSRLFPQGEAVFLTPSFLVSHPCEADQLLSWYKSEYRRSAAHIQLIASAEVVNFLGDVAKKKMAERTKLLAQDPGRNFEAIGLTEKLCKARFSIWQLASELAYVTNAASSTGAVFIHADETLHPCDEQSLVNWFAYWSSLNLHRYRNFRVLGSNDIIVRRISILLEPPLFASDSVAHPDQLPTLQAAFTAARSHETSLLHKDGASDFTYFLDGPKLQAPIIKVYRYPISYLQSPSEMAQHFGDHKMTFHTATSWLGWMWTFSRQRQAKPAINTHVCFCYTIKDDWDKIDKKSYRYGAFPPRYPWIAVLRPVQPQHVQSYEFLEVIIWDLAANEVAPGEEELHESDLLPAQQAFVEIMRKECLPKHNMPLRQVWFGAPHPTSAGHGSAIDRTLKMIEVMVDDNKMWLPASETSLVTKGYRKVLLGKRAPTRTGIRPSPLGTPYTVFHPPSATGSFPPQDPPMPPKKSKLCPNNLLQKTRRAMKTSVRGEMEFQFIATKSWYGQQKSEGRHFEHIQVDTSQHMFEMLGVPRNAGTQ